jgi:oligopeptidase B
LTIVKWRESLPQWFAKGRDHNKGSNPVLFKVNMGAGHGSESGRFERQKLTALKHAFMLDLVGISN